MFRDDIVIDTISRPLGAGPYYVRVDAVAGGAIGYQLRLSFLRQESSPDGRTRQTAHDLGDLTSLASARTFSGTVNRDDDNDDDYRRFTLTASRTMRFDLRNLGADANLYLESSDGTVLAQSRQGSTLDDTIVRTLEAGTYYVRVDAYAAGNIDYDLSLSQESVTPRSPVTSSQRLWRDRDMTVGRNLRTNEADRFRETSGILTA